MKSILVLVLLAAFITAETNVAGKWFDRIMIVFLENQGLEPVLKNPVFKNMTKYGTLLTNYHGSYHPSQPNYVAVIAGDNMGVRNDGQYELKGDSIVDLLEKKGVSWKTYQENYPGNCFAEMKNYPYMRKHNAFISFDQIRKNKERCARIVNADHLWNDIGNNTLPQYSFYTPNMINDGHDSGIEGSAKFIGPFVSRLLSSSTFMEKTLLVVSYDEDDNKHDNKVYTMLFGPSIKKGAENDKKYSHFSLLRTVEDNWNLGTLGRNDATATPIEL